eukprot:m.13680 g.13680  ORF g.13680 m.13680 type:complete len:93 (-) comp10203_c0_seq2:201-479(-)
MASEDSKPTDGDLPNIVEVDDDKANLIKEVLQLQNTLDELSSRVDSVRDENEGLKDKNVTLTQYIENLMASSTMFQQLPADPSSVPTPQASA